MWSELSAIFSATTPQMALAGYVGLAAGFAEMPALWGLFAVIGRSLATPD